jgi:dipeptidyl aminopeptidase
MRLSGDDGLPSNTAGPSEATEMRQTKSAFVDPLITRPRIYYGDGPFDPPSSDDEDDLVVTGGSDSDAESVSLLDANRGGPSTPGRAERGEPNPRRGPDAEKVRNQISSYKCGFI